MDFSDHDPIPASVDPTDAANAAGTFYKNSLTVGARGSLGKLINWMIRAFMFDEARGQTWINHNIEEVGNFESFLPQLYAAEATTITA
jgi:hypothetical protein